MIAQQHRLSQELYQQDNNLLYDAWHQSFSSVTHIPFVPPESEVIQSSDFINIEYDYRDVSQQTYLLVGRYVGSPRKGPVLDRNIQK